MKFIFTNWLESAVDKLVDEYLKGVVTYKYPFAGSGRCLGLLTRTVHQALQKDAHATTVCIK